MDNPLDDIIPNFNAFGAEFTQMWQKVLAGLWGLAIIAAIVFVVISLVQMGQAKGDANPGYYQNARSQAVKSLISLGCVAGLSVLVGAILFIANAG